MAEMMHKNDHKTSRGGERRLSFSLGSQRFAIPLLSVKEVIAVPGLTPVPFTPSHFLGIMNLRGQVISVLDLRKKLDIKPGESTEQAVIICDLSPLTLGVLVDSVDSVLSPDAASILPKPEGTGAKHTEYITGIFQEGNDLVLLLDIISALDAQDFMAIDSSATKKSAA